VGVGSDIDYRCIAIADIYLGTDRLYIYSNYVYSILRLCGSTNQTDIEREAQKVKENYLPIKDAVCRYLGNATTEDTPLRDSAAIHLGILLDMRIKLTQDEIEHLFSLPSEVAIENWCHKIIMTRL
jgi:hypothetical protein